jgi:alkanesulfonate monooxygenase SsuD/methylene tetrahydromethanopterin reductase-like flavin-dependent oxidoreductase (luciferase family)
MKLKFGVQLWNQVFDWPSARSAAETIESLGFDHLWTMEHLLAVMGEPDQDTFDAYTLLTAWSQVTERVQLGVLTGANTFRNPGLLAKMVTTLDHVSGGRAILGLGGGWHELEHKTFGLEFGRGFGDRLSWLDESAAALRGLLDGQEATSPEDGHYALSEARLHPLPVQDRLPILIGGSGEKKTLRTVARYADIWNMVGSEDIERMRHKAAVLDRHCEEVGRDPSEIERSVFLSPVIRHDQAEARSFYEMQMEANRTPLSAVETDADMYVEEPGRMTELMLAWKEIGFTTFIVQSAAPFDAETARIVIEEIKPVLERA